jgi:hypothetical protein
LPKQSQWQGAFVCDVDPAVSAELGSSITDALRVYCDDVRGFHSVREFCFLRRSGTVSESDES